MLDENPISVVIGGVLCAMLIWYGFDYKSQLKDQELIKASSTPVATACAILVAKNKSLPNVCLK